MPQHHCPICGRKADVIPNTEEGHLAVACKFCGRYRIADALKGDSRLEENRQRLAQLTWYWDQSGSPLAITETNVDEHIAEAKRYDALLRDDEPKR